MICPHCHKPIQAETLTTEELRPFFAEFSRRIRPATPRSKVLKPCPKCATLLGTRELRKHIPTCKKGE